MGKKVLIVDDSLLVRTQVSRALKQLGHVTIDAVDGVDALAKLQANDDVALVVCDVNMPKMGGMELLEELRNRPELAKLDFVMLTTEGQADTIARAKELGAKGWIRKPFTPDVIVNVANQLLGAA